MKTSLLTLCIVLSSAFALRAGESAAEKAFVEKYKTAYEAKDTKTLESFLYTKGAHPMALEFYKMMMTEGAGGKIGKIELLDLTPEEQKKTEGIQEGPGGQKTKLPLKVTKKLEISMESKSAEGSGSSSNTVFVAEKDGKLVIPVPAPVK
jgi:hypothetical protein